MDHVVLHDLRTRDQIANYSRVFRDVDFQCIFDGTDAGDGMHHGANAANALRPDPCFAGIAALQNEFDPAEHGTGAPGVGNLSAVYLRFDAQMTFNTIDRIDNEACHVSSPYPWRRFGGLWRRLNHLDEAMGRDTGKHRSGEPQAQFAGRNVDAEAGNVGQPVVERRHVSQKRGDAQAIQPWPARIGQLV